MDLAEIQHAIEELPEDQQAALVAWIAERDQAEWEAEIERDFSPGGAAGAFLEEMKADVRAGKFHPFEEGLPHLKQVGEFWTVRIGQSHRGIGYREGDTFNWGWIGSHEAYNKLVRRMK